MTDPKVLAELRESIKHCYERDVVSIQVSAFRSLISDSERLAAAERYAGSQTLRSDFKTADEMRAALDLATERLREAEKKIRELSLECHSYLSQLAQPHEDPRLRIAAEGLGKISTYDDDGTWGNARIKDIAREYLAKIKETE